MPAAGVVLAVGRGRGGRDLRLVCDAPVDLMVPEAGAGAGRRGVRVPPRDSWAMRRVGGLEAALVDNSRTSIGAVDPAADPREFTVAVAGPAALLVAKLHEIHDRIDTADRLNDKDAHQRGRAYHGARGADRRVRPPSHRGWS